MVPATFYCPRVGGLLEANDIKEVNWVNGIRGRRRQFRMFFVCCNKRIGYRSSVMELYETFSFARRTWFDLNS